MSNPAKNIRIGTMIAATEGDAPARIKQICRHGLRELRTLLLANDKRPGSGRDGKMVPRSHR